MESISESSCGRDCGTERLVGNAETIGPGTPGSRCDTFILLEVLRAF